ncbi:hypothetical protein NBO_77g0001 [Nosema bombycis CQ1]|uniref:Uncharacterized protein n=1 Tax=Nosema bombycis (strain CQ1 / CVCC 102059) TaxID=578461 RepID=R0KRL7_NOSB1|nr:hypothetical protein NBO_77g0001 [Nosema bombycis CQ1]|eukprot:EOB13391.1 hypothetical protein NBO_77g0001 [Nosema bombycis CQ1]
MLIFCNLTRNFFKIRFYEKISKKNLSHMKIPLIYIISVYGACFSERCPETKKRFYGLVGVACDVLKVVYRLIWEKKTLNRKIIN